jgi:hypothetical protein
MTDGLGRLSVLFILRMIRLFACFARIYCRGPRSEWHCRLMWSTYIHANGVGFGKGVIMGLLVRIFSRLLIVE